MSRALRVFLAVVLTAGAALVAYSVASIARTHVNAYFVALAVLTVASGRIVIDVPGRAATVSVSEVFVFATVVLFGPEAATLIVAVDGLWTSLTQKHRRAYRALFNIAEPAISTWTAGHVFLLVAGLGTAAQAGRGLTPLVASIAMAATFFALNSGLTSVAIALEAGTSAFDVWRRHATYLAINYYAAASLATLAVGNGQSINVTVLGLVFPLLVLSYVAYQQASTRIDAAHRHVDEVEHLYRAATEMLAIAVDAKDQVTHGHIRRVQRQTLAVARALGVSDLKELKAIDAGALLHDIGKLAVPDYVLNKPSALTRAEYEAIKVHAPMGARILQAVDFPYPVVPIVRHHHEQWDGGGYPDGLAGTEIPLGARILSVVDCYDALTSDRPYRPRLSTDQAIEILRSRRGTFYDPAVVDKFVTLIPSFTRDEEAAAIAPDVRGGVVAGLARGGHDRNRVLDVLEARPALPSAIAAHIDRYVTATAGVEACLFDFNVANDRLVVAHATARIRGTLESFCVPVGAGVSGWVAAHRNTIRRADATLDLGSLGERVGLAVCVSTPVFAAADLRGVLTVYATEATRLTDDVIAGVGTLALEVGLLMAGASSIEKPARIAQLRTLKSGSLEYVAS